MRHHLWQDDCLRGVRAVFPSPGSGCVGLSAHTRVQVRLEVRKRVSKGQCGLARRRPTRAPAGGGLSETSEEGGTQARQAGLLSGPAQGERDSGVPEVDRRNQTSSGSLPKYRRDSCSLWGPWEARRLGGQVANPQKNSKPWARAGIRRSTGRVRPSGRFQCDAAGNPVFCHLGGSRWRGDPMAGHGHGTSVRLHFVSVFKIR